MKNSQISLKKWLIFNKYFASQCTPLQNSSSLPTFYLKTEKSLFSVSISEDDILALLKTWIPINPMDGMICVNQNDKVMR